MFRRTWQHPWLERGRADTERPGVIEALIEAAVGVAAVFAIYQVAELDDAWPAAIGLVIVAVLSPFAAWFVRFVGNCIAAPYRLLRDDVTKAKASMDRAQDELRTIYAKRVSPFGLTARAGRDEHGRMAHRMQAELDVKNISDVTLTGVTVTVSRVERFYEWYHNDQLQIAHLDDDGLGSFSVLWSPLHGSPAYSADIPAKATKAVIVAYSDDSNGTPGRFNTTGSYRPVMGSQAHRLTISISANEVEATSAFYYLECFGNRVEQVGQSLIPAGVATFAMALWDEYDGVGSDTYEPTQQTQRSATPQPTQGE